MTTSSDLNAPVSSAASNALRRGRGLAGVWRPTSTTLTLEVALETMAGMSITEFLRKTAHTSRRGPHYVIDADDRTTIIVSKKYCQ